MDLRAALPWRFGAESGRKLRAQTFGDGSGAARVVEEDLERSEAALPAKKLLRPADVHDGEARLCGGGRVAAFDERGDVQRLRFAVHEGAESVARFPTAAPGEGRGDSDCAGFAHPAFERGAFAFCADVEGAKRLAGEKIDAEHAEIFAGEIGQRDSAFDEAGDGADAGLPGDGGPERFVHVAADFEVRFAGDEVDAGGEGLVGAVVRDLDREIHGDAEGHAEDIEQREEAVAAQIAQDVPGEDAGKLRGHGGCGLGARAPLRSRRG